MPSIEQSSPVTKIKEIYESLDQKFISRKAYDSTNLLESISKILYEIPEDNNISKEQKEKLKELIARLLGTVSTESKPILLGTVSTESEPIWHEIRAKVLDIALLLESV